MGCNVQRDGESFRTRIIKWSRRRAGPPLHYNVYNIYIYIRYPPTSLCSPADRSTGRTADCMCAAWGEKKLNRNPPTPIPHHRRGPHYPSPTPLPSPDARNCIHPIEFLYRGKRTKRELRAYSIWYIMFVYVLCIRSPRTGRLASGVY